MRGLPSIALAAAGMTLWSTAARAHGFGARYDLPIPLPLYLTGAGLAVGLTFLIMIAVGRRAPAGNGRFRYDLLQPAALRWIAHPAVRAIPRLFGVAVFLLVIAAGLFGNQDIFKNIAPVAVWVIFGVGMSFLAALVGNLWALLNPWNTLALWAGMLFPRRHPPRPWPERCGRWPAVVLFLVYAWVELVWPLSEHPRAIALLVLAYSAITWAGMAVYGRRAWCAGGETFSVFFGFAARFAPLHGETTGGRAHLWLRPWAAGLLTNRPVSRSGEVFVLAMLAVVTFDGLTETPFWSGIVSGLWEFYLTVTGSGGGTTGVLGQPHPDEAMMLSVIYTAGLLLIIAIFWLTYRGVVRLMQASAGGQGLAAEKLAGAELAGWFVLTLMPIAIAYHLAHYLSFLLIAGQYAIPLISDPFGFGWDLFNTRIYFIDIGIVDAKFVWILSIASIVIGHMIAVVLAHLMAMRVYPDPRAALRSQIPMMGLMVGYTMISLWILAQPIVETG